MAVHDQIVQPRSYMMVIIIKYYMTLVMYNVKREQPQENQDESEQRTGRPEP